MPGNKSNAPKPEDLDAQLLEELAAEEAKTGKSGTDWEPEPGDQVLGTVTGFEHHEKKDKSGYVAVIVLDAGAEEPVRVAVLRDILRDEVLKRKVQVGDRLAIRYVGQPAGKRYHRYVVAVAPAGPRDPEAAFSLKPREDSGDSDLVDGIS